MDLAPKPQSLYFAPMEGITDELYRLVILKNFSEWDYVATDFLRVPSAGYYTKGHILEHFGEETYKDQNWKDKTIFQILTSEKAFTEYTVNSIEQMNFDWFV